MARLVVTVSGTGGPSQGPPSTITSVDAYGNLLLFGQPFLPISFSKSDQANMGAAGYTAGEQDAKYQQLKGWGFNLAVAANPFKTGGVYNNVLLYQNYGFYGAWNAGNDFAGNTNIATVVGEFKEQPGNVGWYLVSEASGLTDTAQYTANAATVHAVDGNRRLMMEIDTPGAGGDYTAPLGPAMIQMPLIEDVVFNDTVDGGFITIGLTHLWDHTGDLETKKLSVGQGAFVSGYSTTPVPELDGISTPIRAESLTMLRRWYLAQVVKNIRAFDMLWGPNQRNGSTAVQLTANSQIAYSADGPDTNGYILEGLDASTGLAAHETVTLNGTTAVLSTGTYSQFKWTGILIPTNGTETRTVTVRQGLGGPILGTITPGGKAMYAPGDAGLPSGILDTYLNTGATIQNVVLPLTSVILGPGLWISITTSAPYHRDPPHNNNIDPRGVYAAKKTVGSITYVIAINMEAPSGTGFASYVESPLTGVTVTVGTGTTCTPILSTPAPTSFVGGVITANFAAMEVKVFQVT